MLKPVGHHHMKHATNQLQGVSTSLLSAVGIPDTMGLKAERKPFRISLKIKTEGVGCFLFGWGFFFVILKRACLDVLVWKNKSVEVSTLEGNLEQKAM